MVINLFQKEDYQCKRVNIIKFYSRTILMLWVPFNVEAME